MPDNHIAPAPAAGDVDMADAGTDAAAHTRPMPQERPPKRRRRPGGARLGLLDLSADTLKHIVRQLHAPPRRDALTGLGDGGAGGRSTLLRTCDLAPLLRLRLAHPLLRDAVDAHVAALDLSDLPVGNVPTFVTRFLPRLRNLATLAVPAALQAPSALPLWRSVLHPARADGGSPPPPPLRHLVFLPAREVCPDVAALLTAALARSLESVATAAPPVLTALAAAPGGRVAAAELVMDALDDTMLARLPGLRSLRLLYRTSPLSRTRGQRLAAALERLPHLTSLHVRANGASSTEFDVFAALPRLTRLALFDGRVVGAPQRRRERGDVDADDATMMDDEMSAYASEPDSDRGVQHLVACRCLADVQLEWMDGLSGADVVVLAAGLGDRLRSLRIWNCDGVTDEALLAVARHCPRAEVELRFLREQFSSRALAALGDRVSWASTVF